MWWENNYYHLSSLFVKTKRLSLKSGMKDWEVTDVERLKALSRQVLKGVNREKIVQAEMDDHIISSLSGLLTRPWVDKAEASVMNSASLYFGIVIINII